MSEQNRPDVLTRWRTWFAGQLDLESDQPVFVDEIRAATITAAASAGHRVTSVAEPACL